MKEQNKKRPASTICESLIKEVKSLKVKSGKLN